MQDSRSRSLISRNKERLLNLRWYLNYIKTSRNCRNCGPCRYYSWSVVINLLRSGIRDICGRNGSFAYRWNRLNPPCRSSSWFVINTWSSGRCPGPPDIRSSASHPWNCFWKDIILNRNPCWWSNTEVSVLRKTPIVRSDLVRSWSWESCWTGWWKIWFCPASWKSGGNPVWPATVCLHFHRNCCHSGPKAPLKRR